ncbi:hypothetical protein [Paractinoplanes durhamensis]|uniref:hypothetical protein n=1 Tax=Paractinoplanes durhamensis TaxID=113563 RepID=UPI003639ECB7
MRVGVCRARRGRPRPAVLGRGARAAQFAGRAAAAAAIRTAVLPFTAADGSVAMRNTFRWTSAVKERP